jgi:hypothetical protein
MAIVNATEHPTAASTSSPTAALATAVRGYDRAAVDAAIARETAHLRELESRAAALECELATPPAGVGVPDPRQKVQRALDLMGAGWDEAIGITAAAEHAATQGRRQAKHRVSAAMATLEERCTHAERAADEAAERMVATANAQAARLLEHAASEHDQAVEAAAALVRTAEDQAKEVATQFAAGLREAQEQQAERIAARFDDADRDVAAAQAELAAARRDAAEIESRAEAAREQILAHARNAAEELIALAGAEIRRRREDNEAALAELGRQLIAAGDRLVGAPVSEATVSR